MRRKELMNRLDNIASENNSLRNKLSRLEAKTKALESDFNKTASDYSALRTKYNVLRAAAFHSSHALDDLVDTAFPDCRRASIMWHNINDVIPPYGNYVLVCYCDGKIGIEYVYSTPDGDPEFLHNDGRADVEWWSELPTAPDKLPEE